MWYITPLEWCMTSRCIYTILSNNQGLRHLWWLSTGFKFWSVRGAINKNLECCMKLIWTVWIKTKDKVEWHMICGLQALPLSVTRKHFLTGLTLCKQGMTHFTCQRRLTNRESKVVVWSTLWFLHIFPMYIIYSAVYWEYAIAPTVKWSLFE